ncbi:MAG: hypothetical protein GY844_08590 [Bradyrhizobium sp.]|nr:hypothetical protein [Bradyrhizobium sp.]
MIQHRFTPNDPIPLFLAVPDKEPEPSRVRKFLSSKLLRKAALLVAAVATVVAVISVGNAIIFASVTASQVSPPAPLDGSGDSTSAIQSTAGVEAAPGSQLGDELAAAIKAARENRAEADRTRADALFNQFQTWAAEEDAHAQPAPQQPVQDVRTDIRDVRTDAVQSPPLPKRRPVHVAHTARSQDSSPQNAPSLTQRFGFRN